MEGNILIGRLETFKCPFFFLLFFLLLLFDEKGWGYFTVKGTYFPHMGGLTWTNRKRCKEQEYKRKLKKEWKGTGKGL